MVVELMEISIPKYMVYKSVINPVNAALKKNQTRGETGHMPGPTNEEGLDYFQEDGCRTLHS